MSTQQKGRGGEYRVAELIMMQEKVALACYEPMADDEGIDLIVKEKGDKHGVVFLQVKSRFKKCFDPDSFNSDSGFTVTAKNLPIMKDKRMAFVICGFDLSSGDLKHVWYVPAQKFGNNKKKRKDGNLAFSKSKGNWKEFRIGPEPGKSGETLADRLANEIQKHLRSLP